MSRTLSMATKPDKIQVNNSSARTVGREIPLGEIIKAEPFQGLFPIAEDKLAAIQTDMANHGFDTSKPVNLWKRADGQRILIDGYTRVLAAEALGLRTVIASEKEFRDERSALEYAIHTQRDRRNLSDADLISLVARVDHPQSGFKLPRFRNVAESQADIPKSSAEETAEFIGVSARTVEKVRAVLKDASATDAVKRGTQSINQAERQLQAKKREQAGAARHSRNTNSVLPAPLAAVGDKICKAFDNKGGNPSYRLGVLETLMILARYHELRYSDCEDLHDYIEKLTDTK